MGPHSAFHLSSGSEHLCRAEPVGSLLRLIDSSWSAPAPCLTLKEQHEITMKTVLALKEFSLQLNSFVYRKWGLQSCSLLHCALFCGWQCQGFSQLSRLNFQIIFNSFLCPVSLCSHLTRSGDFTSYLSFPFRLPSSLFSPWHHLFFFTDVYRALALCQAWKSKASWDTVWGHMAESLVVEAGLWTD